MENYKCELCEENISIVLHYDIALSLKQKIISFIPEIILNQLDELTQSRIKNVKSLKKYFAIKHWAECRNCGIFSCQPQFAKTELDNFYKELFWNKVYSSNDIHFRDSKSLKQLLIGSRTDQQFQFIRKFAPNFDGFFLDFGGGDCAAAIYAFHSFSFQNITVLDKSEFSKFQAHAHGFDYVEDTEELSRCNFIFSSHSLEHVLSLKAVIKELKRLSKSKSYCFIEVPHISDFDALKASKVHAPHTYCFSKRGLRAALAKANFKLVSKNAIEEASEGTVIRALFQKI